MEVYILIHGPSSPNQEDWQAYLDDLDAALAQNGRDVSKLRSMILSDGGAPDAIQRAHINELQAQLGQFARVAVVSDSPLVRGVTRALTWFNPKFKVYSPTKFDDVLVYLEVPQARASVVKSEILTLERELGMRVNAVRPLFARPGAR